MKRFVGVTLAFLLSGVAASGVRDSSTNNLRYNTQIKTSRESTDKLHASITKYLDGAILEISHPSGIKSYRLETKDFLYNEEFNSLPKEVQREILFDIGERGMLTPTTGDDFSHPIEYLVK